MSYRDWHVGMKVVCVTDETSPGSLYQGPKLNEVSTISWIGIDPQGEVSIDLVEHPAPEQPRYSRGWVAEDFRPAAPRKTDISIFTSMLSPERGKVEA